MIIEEGLIKLKVSNVNLKGPGKKGGVFYNRAMVFNRDTSIFVLYNLRPANALDGLAATGVRGLRFIKELGISTTLNDIDPNAVELIKENLKLNDLEGRVTNRNVNSLMSEERFEYIDIDPFGTPVPFIDQALLSGKVLGITATDTATLAGRNARIKRRYLADVRAPPELVHEIGVRVLLGYIGRMAIRFDLGIVPILSLWNGHFYRVYVRIKRGVSYAKKTMSNIGSWRYGGPLWLGELHDFEFLESAKIPPWIPTKDLMEKYLALWRNERGFLFYHIPTLSSELGISTPSLRKIMEALKELGFEATRTQFSDQGIRTDASKDIVLEILRKMSNLSSSG